MYRAVTRQIQVTVAPAYIEEQSAPEKGRYFWSYAVEIVNLGQETVTLRSRYWHIRDAKGAVQEVRGEGVVGKQPVLGPGERFEYTSGCPLETSERHHVGRIPDADGVRRGLRRGNPGLLPRQPEPEARNALRPACLQSGRTQELPPSANPASSRPRGSRRRPEPVPP